TPLGAAPPPAQPAPAAERRLVSVLFADLVGFTSLSETKDAEEVRELLSRYFDTCSRLIGLYGGTVEKFIGDAVMAVWGTPAATEDDAERAVRAALDLVAAVSALGQEVGEEELRARAGVLTGEAAVTIGAEGQGMVAGDLVNTASRLQASAEPGCVYVGESTRRATEQTIVYEDAGSFELKGKEGLVPLWKARRVVSGLRGSLKSEGLEAPFVGRDRELRLIKDLFHASADDRKAHLVSVTGIAGIGKSRLGWEFYKYFDGIAETVWWHRGRCLAYGEGVTYWALADMVRMRCQIAEDEQPRQALEKLRSTLSEHVLDADERRFMERGLAQLLGAGETETAERQELFAGVVPGMPAGLKAQILERAEGVPLYAVETVRMLLDRGLLARDGTAYHVVGEIEALEVPETLHALIAARLDGLSEEERRLLQDAAVLGKTFSRRALAALAETQEAQLQPSLESLVRKEVLSLQADPRSPEHGQYGFLQDLVRRVAYETLSRRDRKSRHLAAADAVAATLAEEEMAEVIAAHLLAAYEAVP